MFKKLWLSTTSIFCLCLAVVSSMAFPADSFGKLWDFFIPSPSTTRAPLPQLGRRTQEQQQAQPSLSSSSSSSNSTAAQVANPEEEAGIAGLPLDIWCYVQDFVATGEHGPRDLSSLSQVCRSLRSLTQTRRMNLAAQAMVRSHSPIVITPADLTEERMRELQGYYLSTPSITINNISPNDPKDYLPKILLLGKYFPMVRRLSFLLHEDYNPSYSPGEMFFGMELVAAINRLRQNFPHLNALELKTKEPLRSPGGLAQLPERLIELRVRIHPEVPLASLTDAFSHFNNLRILDIHGSGLSDADLNTLSRLPFVETLRELDISGNRFSADALYNFLKRCTNLRKLRIANNQIKTQNGNLEHLEDGLIAVLKSSGVSSKLETLDIRNNGIRFSTPNWMSTGFENLINLDLRNNPISQTSLKALAKSDFAKKLTNFQHDPITE